MQKIITCIISLAILSSCMVSTKSYNEMVTRESANTILLNNQSDEITKLKEQNNALTKSNLLLVSDTIRLDRNIRLLKADYLDAIERGATSNISLQRQSDEYKNSIRRQSVLIEELKDVIMARNNKINILESDISLNIEKYLDRDCAVLYQTKMGLTLEINDCKVLNDSVVAESMNQFLTQVSNILVAQDQVTLVVESYSAQNEAPIVDDILAVDNIVADSVTGDSLTVDSLTVDSLTIDTMLVDTQLIDTLSVDTISSVVDFWSMNLKKGAFYATKLIENGVNKETISVLTPSQSYKYDIPFSNGCELITVIKFNVDAEHIIEMFDKIVKNRDI